MCTNSYKSDLVQSLFMTGLFVGNLVGGALADQRGRRAVVIVSVVGMTVFSILAASPVSARSHAVYTMWRVAAGLCAGAYGLLRLVSLSIEGLTPLSTHARTVLSPGRSNHILTFDPGLQCQ